MEDYREAVAATVRFLRKRIDQPPEIILVLGTGLGGLADRIEDSVSLSCAAIPYFPKATGPGHAGNLVFGILGGKSVAALQGRFHYYEGYSTRELTTPVRALSLLGAETCIVTSCAGGLNTNFRPGMLMVLEDHINLIPNNPLRGANIEEWGPRFPDMSQAYDRDLISRTFDCAHHLGIANITTGVYAAIPGPSLETPAETRYLRSMGADAVGMSTVPEVIVARHAGLRTLGISVIANINDPDDFQPIRLEEVIRQTEQAAPVLERLLVEVVQGI